jgi:hypothetical protein
MEVFLKTVASCGHNPARPRVERPSDPGASVGHPEPRAMAARRFALDGIAAAREQFAYPVRGCPKGEAAPSPAP